MSREVSQVERRFSCGLRQLLAPLPVGAPIDESPELRLVLAGLERFTPEVLREIYPFWKRESLDGIVSNAVTKTGELEVEILGLCILMTTQVWMPIHVRLQLSPVVDELSWFECRVGERFGEPTIRGPRSQFVDLPLQAEAITWTYAATFGERSAIPRPMFCQYRVTKYNPANRNLKGIYRADEWTSCGDIGHVFAGVELTPDGYQKVEDAYVAAALEFLKESGCQSLHIVGLENSRGYSEFGLDLMDGTSLALPDIDRVVRLNLQEKIWCKLEDAGIFIHFGYDYYMYLGVPSPSVDAARFAQSLGLFVEMYASPYSVQKTRERVDESQHK